MKPLLIIKPGAKLDELNSIDGDFDDWILAGMQWPGDVIVCRVHDNEILPAINGVCGVVITGSGAMVTDNEPWMEITADWLRKASTQIPVLGICFGHQLLANAMGGDVSINSRGVEVGCVEIKLKKAAKDDPLFGKLPTRLLANASHLQSVIELPAGAVCLASSELEKNHAFRIGDRVWGVQFHPEFNAEITRYYIDFYRDKLQEQGRKTETLHGQLADTPEAVRVLLNFSQLLVTGN